MLSQTPELLLGCRTCPLAPGDEGVVLLAPELACGQAGHELVDQSKLFLIFLTRGVEEFSEYKLGNSQNLLQLIVFRARNKKR